MEKFSLSKCFLGANSYGGFYSLYDRLSECGMLYILKGGPGCGKSSFMRKIASRLEDAGLDVEYVLCSGDPHSLDAIIVPQLGIAYADGTAPHVLEPKYPAVSSCYINLGEYYDVSALSSKCGLIAPVFSQYKEHYKSAYSLLAAAGSLPAAELPESAVKAARKRAAGIISREIKRRDGSGGARRCFVSAFCCLGQVSEYESIQRLCGRIYVLDSRFGLASPVLDDIVAAASGYELLLCCSPLEPDKASHVLIPELSLAFVTNDTLFPFRGSAFRHIRLDALYLRSAPADVKKSARSYEKLRSSLLGAAQSELACAKSTHDELERLYNPHVDFASVYRLAEEHARKCLSLYASTNDCKAE